MGETPIARWFIRENPNGWWLGVPLFQETSIYIYIHTKQYISLVISGIGWIHKSGHNLPWNEPLSRDHVAYLMHKNKVDSLEDVRWTQIWVMCSMYCKGYKYKTGFGEALGCANALGFKIDILF